MDDIITLDHGSGGKKTAALIRDILLPALDNPALAPLADGAVLPPLGARPVLSTDSFVIAPYFFPGGDIGKLAVCGTVNDLCMCGAKPLYLTLGLILEEGLPLADLKRIIDSLAQTAAACHVQVVTGDTKVVERGKGDGVYINTAGMGALCRDLSPQNIREGDAVLLSGTAGDHGAAVMLAREGMGFAGALLSDCAPLDALAAAAWTFPGLRALRDPTRGGVATALNELMADCGLCAELSESAIPIRPDVASVCALLGLDPLYCANEGKLLAIVDPTEAEGLLAALRALPHGADAAIIGRVTTRAPGRALLNTALGGARVLQTLAGAQLPRIC